MRKLTDLSLRPQKSVKADIPRDPVSNHSVEDQQTFAQQAQNRIANPNQPQPSPPQPDVGTPEAPPQQSSQTFNNQPQVKSRPNNPPPQQTVPRHSVLQKLQQLQQYLTAEDEVIKQIYKDNPTGMAHSERRRQSFGCLPFLQDHLLVVVTIQRQMESRCVIAKESISTLIRYFKSRVVQLKFVLQEEKQFQLGKLYDLNDDQTTLYPKLQGCLQNLELKTQERYQTLLQKSSWLESTLIEKIEKPHKASLKELQSIEKEIRTTRGQIEEAFDIVLKNVTRYTQCYYEIMRNIMSRKLPGADLFTYENKFTWSMNEMINLQKQLGCLVQRYRELFESSENETLMQIQDYSYQGWLDGDPPLNIDGDEIKAVFDPHTLLGDKLADIVSRYCRGVLDHASLRGFMMQFRITQLNQNHPLLLKQIQIQRDVAWERSLTFGIQLVNCSLKITVDGFLLFYDENNVEPNQIVSIENLQLNRDAGQDMYTMSHGGLLKNPLKHKVRIKFIEEMDADVLYL